MRTEGSNERTIAKIKNKGSLRRHEVLDIPLLGGVLLMFYAFLAYQIAGIPAGDNETLSGLLGILCSAALLVIHRWWFRPELRSCLSFSFLRDKGLLAATGIFFLAVTAAWIPGVIRQGFAMPTVFTLIEALAAGFCEETAFRVLPVSVMMRSYKNSNRYLPALLLPAVLFGLMHFINLYGGGDVLHTVMQVFNASAAGIFWAAVYLRSGSFVPSFLIHFLYDFIVFMQATPADAVTVVTASELLEDGFLDVVQLVLVIMLLKGRKQEIISTWKNIWGGV